MTFSGIPLTVQWLREGAVGNSEHQAHDEEGKVEDPAHPCEGNDGSQKPAGLILAAPVEIAPVVLFASI